MPLIDTHAHVHDKAFDADRDAVVERMRAAGVATALTVGCDLADTKRAFDTAERYDLRATAGIHPHEAKDAPSDIRAAFEPFLANARIVAIGEIGLDYYYDHSPRETQRAVFIRQMELAGPAKLPIVVHCRPSENSENAWEDCLTLMEQHWKSSGIGGVLHCFTGTWAYAKRALDMGFMISFAGNVTFPKAQQIRNLAAQVPLQRMLIETDSPFLAPVPHRGKRNEPALVKEVARQVGELRGLSTDDLGAQTSENFYRFFSIPASKAIQIP